MSDYEITKEGLHISNVAGRMLSEDPDEDGDIKYAYKATVHNPTKKPISFWLSINIVDSDEFTLESGTLHGLIQPGQTKTFSDTRYINKALALQANSCTYAG